MRWSELTTGTDTLVRGAVLLEAIVLCIHVSACWL